MYKRPLFFTRFFFLLLCGAVLLFGLSYLHIRFKNRLPLSAVSACLYYQTAKTLFPSAAYNAFQKANAVSAAHSAPQKAASASDSLYQLSLQILFPAEAYGEQSASCLLTESRLLDAGSDPAAPAEASSTPSSPTGISGGAGLSSANASDSGENAPPSSSAAPSAAPAIAQAAATGVLGIVPNRCQPSGTVYTAAMLSDYDYLLNTFFTLDSTTAIDKSLLNADKLIGENLQIVKKDEPQILIYHTHSQEEFADSVPGDVSTTIIGVGDYLTSLLESKYGYQVLHDTTSYDMIDGELDRNRAYSQALASVGQILEEHPSIEVVIDLHRDGIEGKKMTTMINGHETAKIMFFNGLSYSAKNGAITSLYNPYIADNLAFSLQLQLKAAAYFPGFTRPIYLKCYRYNLHLRPRSLLVEAGSQKNTLQEEKNAMEVLAELLNMVLSGS